ncbi:winged helix-turn-helix domain-containing protein [Shewanella sp.]|uniref:winged helix-turn-helix domain-containing protein n=1 Tax=Shewanella sp. TaxID=50422 RepID=UPI00356809B4
MFNNSRYRLGDYLIVPERCVVSRDGIDTKLELRVMQVLVCLLERAGRPVSRDELIKVVWRGGVVSDNAINRIIALLRNALGDDARSQKVIKTVPKVGYVVVAELEKIEETAPKFQIPLQQGESASEKVLGEGHFGRFPPSGTNSVDALVKEESTLKLKGSLRGRLLGYAAAGLTLSLCIIGGIRFFTPEPSVSSAALIKDAIVSLEPLTSLEGQEVDPVLSPDGSHLAFSFRSLSDEKWQVLIQDLKSGVVSHIDGGNPGSMSSRYPAWSSDGRQLAYLHYDGVQRCEIVLKNVISDESRVIASCGAATQSSALAFRDNQLLFIDSEGIEDFKKIYRLDLDTLHKEQLSQPHVSGRGDLSFTLSPDNSQLAVLRNSGWSDTQLMLFTFSSGEWQSLHKVGYPLRSVAWSSDGRSLIFRAEEGQLHQIDLGSGEITRLTKILQEINSPKSNNNGQITAVVGEMVEEEIWLWESPMIKQSTPKPWISSSRRDYRGTISPDGDKVVFVSNRTGLPQMWIRSVDGVEHKLTDLKRFTYIDELSFSMDGKRVAGTLNGAAFTLDLAGQELVMVPKRTMVRNISFGLDSNELVMSEASSGSNKILLVETRTGDVKRILSKEGFSGKFDKSTGKFYFSKMHEQGIWCLEETGERSLMKYFTPYFSGAWHVENDHIWYLAQEGGDYYLVRYNVRNGLTDRTHIDAKNLSLRTMSMTGDKKVLLSVLTSSNTDVVLLN